MRVHEFVTESGKIGNPEEEVKYREIIEELKEYPEPEEIWTIANIDLINAQIDLLIIKKNGLIIVDFKNIPDKKGATVEIIGNEIGNWKVKDKESGEVKELYENYLSQLKREYSTSIEFLVNNIPKFKKIIENGERSIHILDVLCFNEGATYDYSQLTNKAILKSFKVATPSTIGKIVADYDSNQYLLTKEDIEQILNLFKVESLDFEEELNKLWRELPKSPVISKEEYESMKYKKLHEKFQKLCAKIPTENTKLKAACEHGLALTTHKICDSYDELKHIFERYNSIYEGYKNHILIEDIFIYGSYCSKSEVLENEKDTSNYLFLKQLYEEIILKKWTAKQRYDLFNKIRNVPYTWSIKSMYPWFGRDLINDFPNDFCVLFFAYVYYFWDKKDYKNAGKILKKILTNKTFIEKYKITTFEDWADYNNSSLPQSITLQQHYLDYHLSQYDERTFFEILDSVKQKFSQMLPKEKYDFYVGMFYYWKFKDLYDTLDEKRKMEYFNKAIISLEKALKSNSKGTRYTYRLLSSLLDIKLLINDYMISDDNIEDLYNLIKKIIKHPHTDAWDYYFYYEITRKIMEKHNTLDRSKLIEILKTGLEKYDDDNLLVALASELYEGGYIKESLKVIEEKIKKILPSRRYESEPISTSVTFKDHSYNKVIKEFDRFLSRWYKPRKKLSNNLRDSTYNLNSGREMIKISDLFHGDKGLIFLELYLEICEETNDCNSMYSMINYVMSYDPIDGEEYFSKWYYKTGVCLINKYKEIIDEQKLNIPENEENAVKGKLALDDVILPEEIKELIKDIIEDVKEGYSDSILLYGPPGVGKTRLARAIANELGYEFLEITPGDVLSKWVGETERKIKEYFNKAMQGNVVLFIDEFDGLAMSRDSDVPEWQISKVNQLMKSIEETLRRSKHLLIIAATNYPEKLDRAVIRRGRFNEKIKIPLPNFEARKQLWKYYIDKLAKDKDVKVGNIDYEKLANLTEGFSGADIATIVERNLWRYIRKREKKISMEAIEHILDKNKERIDETRYIY